MRPAIARGSKSPQAMLPCKRPPAGIEQGGLRVSCLDEHVLDSCSVRDVRRNTLTGVLVPGQRGVSRETIGMALNIQPLPNSEHAQLVPYRTKAAVSTRTSQAADRPGSIGTCSVVIVSYRTGPVLIDSLRAALEQDAVDTVVLVDNGNAAETRRAIDALAAADNRLRVIRGHGNVGFARGCNIGVKTGTGSHILLLNPDCVLRPGVVSRGLQVLANHADASALTVRIENTDGTEQRGGRRNLMTPWTCLVEQFRLDRLMPNHPHFQRLNLNETEPLTEITPVECISGAFMLMPRAVYDRVGGMDEDYFLHVEDVDLCFRIQETGG